ncbi:phage tail tape measure protein [Carnobacterium antarcticum]|uniref:Phage tail tape measure protein n=1 Tax=Carnobacterium antarcticum TaxID=2126436 RepID=A0ABW4NN07_9LACT|nr:phage tail tape measure protein [Carnobacterium sp. CP1]ALV21065.1 Phage tail length tape-measure protein [Carnobacterium sp. CP1]
MNGNLGHIAATATLNIDPFQQSTRVLGTQIRSLDKALKAQETAFKNSGKSINSMKATYTQTGQSAKAYSALLTQQKAKYDELKKGIGDVSKATAGQKTDLLSAEAAMNGTASKLETLTGKYNDLGKTIAIQESNWTKVGTSLQAIGDKGKKIGDGLTSFGNKWTVGVTAPIIAGVAGSVKAAIDFESAFAGVKKTVDEVVDSNGIVVISYKELSKGIREMSKELPASAVEISNVAEAAGQLGIQTENVLSFSKTMIDLGESTNMGATEAATALARFANITGLSQDKFSNLGSAIVDLGNNFATTESEIVAMSLRLAGAGAQIGLSEADILGLSAALSSVGIESEAGGSAFSKIMVNMQLAAAKGGQELEDFANIAGMSAADFKKAFETDAVGAIGAFVEGLGKAEEKGTTAIELLDEMGISEVRLRDALLRAGNASELFGGAVEMSNKAFSENTALTEEASKRYETTESKLKILRNQVTDTAIEFGGPFVDALRNGLEAAEPLIQTLGNLAQSFSEASPEMQGTIVKALAFTAAIGPASSILGKFISIGSGGLSMMGGLAKHFGVVSGTAKASSAAFEIAADGTLKLLGGTEALSAGMVGASGSSAGLIASLGAIAPALLVVGGVVAAGAVVWKVWGEDAWKAGERTRKWGTDVGESADKALNEFQTMSDEASLATDLMAFNIEEGTTRAVGAYEGMSNSIKEDIQETISETEEGLAGLPESVRKIVGESMTEGMAEQTKMIAEVDKIQSAITGIYENALAENREVTDAELTVIENYHSRLAEIRSETLQLSAEEQRSVQAVMANDLKEFSAEQLRQRIEMLHEEKTAIQAGYAEQAALLEEQRTSGKISGQEYNDAMSALRISELEDLKEIGAEYIKVWEEQGNVPVEVQKKMLADMGLNYDEIQARIELANQKIDQSNQSMIESSKGASEEVREANEAWNGMILDEKTGEVKTNLDEVITEASQSEEGWNNLEFIMQNAELDTNAKEKIMEALMANGKWWEMDFPTQFADVETNAGETATYFLQSNYDWENMEYKDQMAILNTNTPEMLKQALMDTGVWNNLSPSEQEMIMTTTAGAAAKQALIATGQWDSLSPKQKEMVVTSNSTQKALEGVQAASSWNGKEWVPKDIRVETNAATVASSAQRSIDGVVGKTVTIKTIKENITSYQTIQKGGLGGPRLAKGTNFHIGGLATLGDGGNHEPYLTPQGEFGISPNVDTLFNLPRGTKVWPTIEKFKAAIPKFANGTDIADTKIMNTLSMMSNVTRNNGNRQSPANNSETARESSSQTVINQLVDGQNALTTMMSQLINNSGKPIYFNFNGKQFGQLLVPILDQQDGQRIQDAEGRIFI